MKETHAVVALVIGIVAIVGAIVLISSAASNPPDNNVYYSVENVDVTDQLYIDGVLVEKKVEYVKSFNYDPSSWTRPGFVDEWYNWISITFDITSERDTTTEPMEIWIECIRYDNGFKTALVDYFSPIETIVEIDGDMTVTLHYLTPVLNVVDDPRIMYFGPWIPIEDK